MSRAEKEPNCLRELRDIDRIIHEPARLMILSVLHGIDSADFLFLLSQTGLSKGNLSAHLSRLETAGFVEVEKQFVDKVPRTLLRITPEGRKALERYRQDMLKALDSLGPGNQPDSESL